MIRLITTELCVRTRGSAHYVANKTLLDHHGLKSLVGQLPANVPLAKCVLCKLMSDHMMRGQKHWAEIDFFSDRDAWFYMPSRFYIHCNLWRLRTKRKREHKESP